MGFALLAVIVLVAYGIEAALGFGCNILALTLAANLYPLEQLLPVLVGLNLIVSTYIVLRHRQGIDGRTLTRRILPFMGLGMPLGMFLFAAASGPALKVGFGVFVVALSAAELVRLKRRAGAGAGAPLSTAWGAAALFAGGVIHGLYASGGPLAVYFASRELPEKRRFRSTLSTLWLLLNLVLMTSYVLKGAVSGETAKLAGALLGPVIGGIFAGEWLHGRLDERSFTTVVYALLLAGGVVLVAGR